MSELKPCPFCGEMKTMSTANIDVVNDKGEFTARCPNCGLHLPTSWENSEYAVMRWNTRPIEDALRAALEAEKAKHRWIPVGERLPEVSGRYLVNLSTNMDDSERIYPFSLDFGWVGVGCVTHWQPLPEPPEATE